MGCCCSFVTIGILALLAYIVKKIYTCLTKIPEVPNVDESGYWGPNDVTKDDTQIKPFKIQVSDEDVEDFQKRLANPRQFTPPLEGIHHEYGINSNLLREIIDYWKTKYNWREREVFLNQFPQFTTKIQGLNIHYLHVKPSETKGLKVVPLILLHGWPGSVREFYEAVPKLTTPQSGRNFVFEVVIPSLPGYGFSDAAVRPGLNTIAIAVIFKKLMERLGFDNWYVQGGDWGSEVGTQMAILYPNNILGLHLNMANIISPKALLKRILGSFWPSMIVSKKHMKKMYPLTNSFKALLSETGYFHLQATRPDTLGAAVDASPIGLAAYIMEKFIVWTAMDLKSTKDGGLDSKFGYEKLLDNVMIYWFTRSITTSMRLYAEVFKSDSQPMQLRNLPVQVPSGYAQFGEDMLYLPETILKEKFTNLLHYTELPTGGHFGAFEEPELFSKDVWNAVEKFENYNKNKPTQS